jgi:hypothetical protein
MDEGVNLLKILRKIKHVYVTLTLGNLNGATLFAAAIINFTINLFLFNVSFNRESAIIIYLCL